MPRPELDPEGAWNRPNGLRDAGDEDPPPFLDTTTPGGDAKVSKLLGFANFPITREAETVLGKTAKVTITGRQQGVLRALSHTPTAPSRLRQRATIMLLAFKGLSPIGPHRHCEPKVSHP